MNLSASDEEHVSEAGCKIEAIITEFVFLTHASRCKAKRGECQHAHCPAM